MPILKFKPFNNYFDKEFKVRFDHKDNNSNQIGRIYILFYYYYLINIIMSLFFSQFY